MQNTSENLKTEPEENERLDNQQVIEEISPVDAMVDNEKVMTLPIRQECLSPQDFQKLIDSSKHTSKFWSGGEFRVGKTGNWHFYDTQVITSKSGLLFLLCTIIFNLLGILKLSIFDLYDANNEFILEKESRIKVMFIAFSSCMIFFLLIITVTCQIASYMFSLTIDLEFCDELSIIRVKKHRKLFGCLRMPRIWPDEGERSFDYSFIRDFVLVQPAKKLFPFVHPYPFIAMITKKNEEVKMSVNRYVDPLSYIPCFSFLKMERFYGFRAKCEKVSLLKILLLSRLGRKVEVPHTLKTSDEVPIGFNHRIINEESDFLSMFPAQCVRKDLFPETKTNKKICQCEFPLRSERFSKPSLAFLLLFFWVFYWVFFFFANDFLLFSCVLLCDDVINGSRKHGNVVLRKGDTVFVVGKFWILSVVIFISVASLRCLFAYFVSGDSGTRRVVILTFEEEVLVLTEEEESVRKIPYEAVQDFVLKKKNKALELRMVLKDGKEEVLDSCKGRELRRKMVKMVKIMKKLLARRKAGYGDV